MREAGEENVATRGRGDPVVRDPTHKEMQAGNRNTVCSRNVRGENPHSVRDLAGGKEPTSCREDQGPQTEVLGEEQSLGGGEFSGWLSGDRSDFCWSNSGGRWKFVPEISLTLQVASLFSLVEIWFHCM